MMLLNPFKFPFIVAAAAIFCLSCGGEVPGPEMEMETEAPSGPVFEMIPMLPNGSFDVVTEEGGLPRPAHWSGEGEGLWSADTETLLHGSGSLRLSGPGPVTVVSGRLPLDPELDNVTVVVMGRGPGISAALRWYSHGDTVLREDPLRSYPSGAEDWTRFSLGETAPPPGARRVRLALSGDPLEDAPCWWDAAELTGEAHRMPSVDILYNQAGYETHGPKHFLVASNVMASDGRFRLVSEDGRLLFESPLKSGERVTGADGADWGMNYYRGDFSAYDTAGRLRILVTLGDMEAETGLFSLEFDQVWHSVLGPAVQGLMSFQSNDDAGALWRDPGTPPLADADLFLALVEAWDGVRWRVRKEFGGAPLDGAVREALPAVLSRVSMADWNAADAGETATWAMALAFAARCLPEDTEVMDLARRLTEHLRDRGADGVRAFSAAAALHEATQETAWRGLARQWYPGPVAEAQAALMWIGPEMDSGAVLELGATLEGIGDALLLRAKNPFGVYTTNRNGEDTFFLADADADGEYPGNTHRVLLAAETMARLYRMVAKPAYLGFIHDQLNWVLGCNPRGLCLVEGVGVRHAPLVIPPEGRDRASLAGLVINGYGPAGPGDDRPRLPSADDEPPVEALNGYSLRNSARLVGALSHLKRVRTVIPGEGSR